MTLHYGSYGIFLIMGNAGFIASTVALARAASRHTLALQAVSRLVPRFGRATCHLFHEQAAGVAADPTRQAFHQA